MSFLVISCSLNPESKSRVLARAAWERFQAVETGADFVDLQEIPLPQCDGDGCYRHPAVKTLTRRIQEAEGVLLGVPIYNFGVGAAAKNLIELTGDAWTEKVVGFACAAGGPNSFMSVMGLANSLMLDFHAIIVPHFVYADGSAIVEARIVDTDITRRVNQLADAVIRFGHALKAKS